MLMKIAKEELPSHCNDNCFVIPIVVGFTTVTTIVL